MRWFCLKRPPSLKYLIPVRSSKDISRLLNSSDVYISSATAEQYDCDRFERISNIVKQFKISCSKTHSQFQGMEVKNSHFTAYIDVFTGNTYIMVVMAGSEAITSPAVIQINIAAARKHFEKFIPENS